MFLSSETAAALIGAAGGWILGTATYFGQRMIEGRSARKIAARLVYAELTANMAKVETLVNHGYFEGSSLETSAWEKHRSELLYGASEETLDRLARAYAVLRDVAYLATMAIPREENQARLDEDLDVIKAGRIEAGQLGDIHAGLGGGPRQ